MQWGALYQRMREQQRRQRATAQVLQRLPCSAQMLRCDYTVRKYYGFIVRYQKHVARINLLPGGQAEQRSFVMRGSFQTIALIDDPELAAALLDT